MYSYEIVEAAAKEYGRDKLKIYTSSFVPLYHAVTTRKIKSHMKLICVLPNEKVGFAAVSMYQFTYRQRLLQRVELRLHIHHLLNQDILVIWINSRIQSTQSFLVLNLLPSSGYLVDREAFFNFRFRFNFMCDSYFSSVSLITH